jgi:hypothetical protein
MRVKDLSDPVHHRTSENDVDVLVSLYSAWREK